MSVYTALTIAQIQAFADQYRLMVARVEPIENGIENSNWFVSLTDGTQAVLTVFEELSFEQAHGLAGLLDVIAQSGLPVAAPCPNTADQRLGWLADKPAQLAPRLQGTHPMQPTLAQCQAMGEGLARLHVSMQTIDFKKPNAHGQTWWQQTALELRPKMSAADQVLLDQLFATFSQVQTDVGGLPQGLIHGDVFRDNTLFIGDQLSGILDFSECCHDDYLLDIAITLNDFCSDWPNIQLEQAKQRAFLQRYQNIRPLTKAEKIALPIYLAMAAGRFWLSRLQVAQRNQAEERVGEHVLQKDPNQMREMLFSRLKVC